MQSSAVETRRVIQPQVRDRSIYVPHPDEIQMTFQVGMVGTDGVLLASDLLYTGYAGDFRQSGSGSKIIYDGKQIAYCASGGSRPLAVASHYAKYFCEGDGEQAFMTRQRLIDARNSVEKEFTPSAASDGELLLAQAIEGHVELWHMGIRLGDYSAPHPPPDRYCIGDTRNSAMFFVERYAPRTSTGGKLQPLERLKLLAAHTILTAARLNQTGIGGLEMLICKPDGFRFVSVEEIADLKSKSDTLDREIGHRFFPGRLEDAGVLG
jgi:hypothetical protein